jgi:hypothetical protein
VERDYGKQEFATDGEWLLAWRDLANCCCWGGYPERGWILMSEIDALIVQQVLLHRAPSKVSTITAACNALAEDYGVTPETLRTYAHKGIPGRSKIARRMLNDYALAEAENFGAVAMVSAAKKNLLASIEEMSKAYRDSADILDSLRESLSKEKE